MDARPGRIVDVSRLLVRLSRWAPTGIDRVEFAYAQYYANRYKKGIVRFFVTTPLFRGRMSPFFARHIARFSLDRWSLDEDVASDQTFSDLLTTLSSPISNARGLQHKRIVEPRVSTFDWATSTLLFNAYYEAVLSSTFQARRQEQIQRQSWYLHVSHMNLHEPKRLAWIRKHDGRALFMIHDLFPISHPEYYPPREADLHRRRVETVARLGSLVIFNSAATKTAWDDYLRSERLPRPPNAVVPLGVDRAYLGRGERRDPSAGSPYFVVLGTLEARKNLSLLLDVWRSWVRKSDRPQARLVLVGRRRSGLESAVALLDRSEAIESTIVEVADLADIRVARLLRGARALLAPSFMEGFGLPVAEALALGVPVVASDIGAHREAGGAAAEYLDPLDGHAWAQALDDYVDPSSPRLQAALTRAAAYRPRSWDDHIQSVEDLLREVNSTARS